MPRPRLKVCCIENAQDAKLAVDRGADAIGLVSEMPSGPGVIDDRSILEIARGVPPGVATFLLTCRTEAKAIIAQQRFCRTDTLQLVRPVSREVRAEVRSELPGIRIVQVVHVQREEDVETARRAAEGADALLLDSCDFSKPVPELGGTGRPHDWSISRRIVESVRLPVYLAGGLKAENLREAWRAVRPFGLDICSGLRTDGHLDERKLAAVLAELESLPKRESVP